MDIDFREMCRTTLDDLDVRKAHWNVVRQDDPEEAVALAPQRWCNEASRCIPLITTSVPQQ
jgi:hypothetical protein